jgi:hypothetical protein
MPKPGKNLMDVSSYRPISLLPTISKVLDKLIQKINQYILESAWVPNHQFGFRQAHSTLQQCHRITDVINKVMENQQYWTATFWDLSQAFDTVWHPGLLFKIRRILPSSYFNLLKSYLNEHQFETKFNWEISSRFHIHSGVHQGIILGPLLYVLYFYNNNIFINCNCVVTRWQYTFTHKQYTEQHK